MSHSLRHRGPLLAGCALALLALAASTIAPAQTPSAAGYAFDEPAWRFTSHDRPVKVVLLAGSIGAFRDQPYGRLIHQWCGNAEVRNLSAVGQGAYQLYQRFRTRVLDNPQVPTGAPGVELWLLYHGGMNSVGNPELTNRYIRQTTVLAHRRGWRVAAMTLTPWGSEDDERRWSGALAFRALRNTRRIVDFVMGRLAPREALGRLRNTREGDPDSPWAARERPDVAIDLYDSALRDRDAPPRSEAASRAALRSDPFWRRVVADLEPDARDRQLEVDARMVSEAPRWYLRREYRGFDHVHPNREGHRLIAEIACPRLPESWGCRCPQ